MQRILDIVLSGAALLLLSPVLLMIIFILRFSGEGEIFYKQNRVGKGGQRFGVFKFATMMKNSENMGTGTITVKNDPRVLPFGRVLRKTKVNELPQLLNIFLGDMSVVGPRPQEERCFNAFPERSQEEIIKVRPGLSGIGSIVFRDEEELMHAATDKDHFYDSIVMPYKGLLEEWYVANYGLPSYFFIIFATVWVVLFPTSSIIWRLFPELPKPPDELSVSLN